jgi:arylsulfatase A-like enzyme
MCLNRWPKGLTCLVAAGLAAMAAISCRGTKSADLVRLTELLTPEDIVQSPLTDLPGSFRPITQTVRAADLRTMDKDGQGYWAFASSAPILSLPEEDVPEKAVLRTEGEEWRFSETPLDSSPTWRRIKGDQTVSLIGARPGETRKGALKLAKGKSLRASLFLPGGDVLFEFSAQSAAPESTRPRLIVTVNDTAREIVLGPSVQVRFVEKVPMGVTLLSIAFDLALPAAAKVSRTRPEAVLIRSPRVRASSDLILVSLPPGRKPPSGNIEFTFVPEPADVYLPLGKNMAPGDVLTQKLNLPPSGLGTLTITGRSASRPGRLRVWLGQQALGDKELPAAGYFMAVFPMPRLPGEEALRFTYEAEGAGASGTNNGPNLWLDSLVWRNPQRSFQLPLYLLRAADLKDSGTRSNPGGLLKKARIRGASWNAILAPAPSLLRIEVRVPDKGVLRLGYGLFKEADESEGNGAGFEVSVECGGRKDVLWSAFLDPFHNPTDRDVFFRDIDLAAYGKKSVSLAFRTFGTPGGGALEPGAEDLRSDLAFWANPTLFPKTGASGPDKKNVILISMDAVRADHLGCYGYDRDTTPNLDRLAKDSTLFLNTISQAPYTLASHMTMLTGLYPTTHRVFYFSDSLDPSVPTLADRLRGRGLVTAAFTGGGLMDARYGYARGFDEFHDHLVAQESMDTISPLSRSVSAWLDRNKGQNFFLFLHTYQVHSPYWPPPAYANKFLDKGAAWMGRSLEDFIGSGYVHKYRPLPEAQRRNVIALYDGDISFLDDTLIRPLLEDLKRRNLYDQTMIIVTADHGEEFFDHISWGHSNTLYNELLKVPLIIKFPESRFPGRRLSPFVRLADIVPTVLDEFGLKTSPVKLDGGSLFPLLYDKEKEMRLCVSYLPGDIFADPTSSKISLVQGRYKFILNEKYPSRAYSYFSPPPPEVPAIELFDLKTDPQERKNLAGQEGAITRRMLQEAQVYLQSAKRQGQTKKALLDKELEERLRTLGYIK